MTSQERQRVLDGALELCGTHALRDIGLDQLARLAGVSSLDIVRTFLSKENILKAVLERELEMMAAAAHDPALRMPGETLRDELMVLARVILDEYRRRLPLLGRLLAEAMNDPEVGAVFYRTFIVQGRQLFTEFLSSRARLGELRDDVDVEAAAAMFLSSLTGALLMVELFGGKHVESLDDLRYVSQIADVFLQGVGRP
jgi:AcrR family transcriptional regulator